MPKPNPFAVAAAAVQIGKGVYDAFDAARKNKESNKIRKETKRPINNRQTEIDDIANLTTSEVQNTTLADSLERQSEQGLSQGIDAVLKSGGKADFSTIYSNYGSSMDRAIQQQARDRSAKIAAANTAKYNLAKAKDTEWQYNVDAPYKDAMKMAAMLKEQAAKAKADAFTNIAGGFSNLGTSMLKPGEGGKKDVPVTTTLSQNYETTSNPDKYALPEADYSKFVGPVDDENPEELDYGMLNNIWSSRKGGW